MPSATLLLPEACELCALFERESGDDRFHVLASGEDEGAIKAQHLVSTVAGGLLNVGRCLLAKSSSLVFLRVAMRWLEIMFELRLEK